MPGIWIVRADDHARDSTFNERGSARRCSAEGGAGFKRNVDGCAAKIVTGAVGSVDCVYFGVWFAGAFVETFAEDLPVADDHCAHHWVGRGAAVSALGQAQGATHEFFVCRGEL